MGNLPLKYADSGGDEGDILSRLRVVHYYDKRIKDPFGTTKAISTNRFHDARNNIVEVCMRFGSVGPNAAFTILGEGLEPETPVSTIAGEAADFWIVDDQYNHERYIYIDIQNSACLTAKWLAALCATLSRMDNWAVCVSNISDGYVIIFDSMMLVSGSAFELAASIADVLNVMRNSLIVSSG